MAARLVNLPGPGCHSSQGHSRLIENAGLREHVILIRPSTFFQGKKVLEIHSWISFSLSTYIDENREGEA